MSKKDSNIEIEVRFLEVDKEAVIQKLHALGAQDLGEDMLQEMIFYPKERKEGENTRYIRIRKRKNSTVLSFKHRRSHTIDGMTEIELEIDSSEKARHFVEELGWEMVREQEKLRHTFMLDSVAIDIDTWPKIPCYVEIEGESEEAVKNTALKLGFDWKDAVFEGAGRVIEKYYHVPVFSYKYFTFNKCE